MGENNLTSNRITARIPQGETFSIKGKEIFPIYMDAFNSNESLIFARGHRIIIKNNPKLALLIDQLNNLEYISFNSIRQLMEPIWNLIEVYGFIQELLSVEAILTDEINNENVA